MGINTFVYAALGVRELGRKTAEVGMGKTTLSYPAVPHFSPPDAGTEMASRYSYLSRLEGKEVWFMKTASFATYSL